MRGENHGSNGHNTAISELPEPDAVARQHSDTLSQLIKSRIRQAGGEIAFSDYMSAVLYEPGLGYYMAGAVKFGVSGDFITAPEVSGLFGQTLAAQIKPIIESNNGEILELGAGSGQLALDIIEALKQVQTLRYRILEPSADLMQRQQQRLQQHLPAELFEKVQWLDTLPEHFTGVIVANEVVDALPVERFRIDGGIDSDVASDVDIDVDVDVDGDNARRILQLRVNEHLDTVARAAGDELKRAVSRLENDIGYSFPAGYESEIRTVLAPWVSSLADCLDSGVLLLVDYGYPRREYYLQERNTGTLACYYQHRAHDDPYHWPGLQDITAHVDFTALVEAALSADLELLGYTTQSAFLLNNGLLDHAQASRENMNSEADRLKLAKAVKTLTLPGEMGERFQVMALGKGYDLPLVGFQTHDLSHRL